jgi:ornithine decarboxylase
MAERHAEMHELQAAHTFLASSRIRTPTEISRRAILRSVDSVVARRRLSYPLLCLRPAAIGDATRHFVRAFPGNILYAVKCNPEPRMLRAVWAGGVRHFDYASLAKVALVRAMLPEAEIHFMHPVKARSEIRAAFHVLRGR